MRAFALCLLLAACAQSAPPADTLTVRTPAEAVEARQRALEDVFGGAIPDALPSLAVPVVPVHGAARNVALVGAHAFYLTPADPAGKLAIYHAGHGERALMDGAYPVRELLANGYHVLAMRMPAKPHRDRPLRDFMEPVSVALNYALAQQPFSEVVMTGISGGGWTTAVYAALDTRVTRSVPVAGTWPDALRKTHVPSMGDAEQELPGLSMRYLDLYALAASGGRESVQVFNRKDPCCFAGDAALAYRDAVASVAPGFDVVVVENDQHSVSPEAMRVVLGD